MFETFNAAGLFFGPAPVLALHGSSRQSPEGSLTGLVLHSGHDCTRAIPVVDGRLLHSRIRTSEVAGRHLTLEVEKALR